MASAIEPVAFMQRVLENFRPSLISEFPVLENNCPRIFWEMILLLLSMLYIYMLFFLNLKIFENKENILQNLEWKDDEHVELLFDQFDIFCNKYLLPI